MVEFFLLHFIYSSMFGVFEIHRQGNQGFTYHTVNIMSADNLAM